MNNKLFVFQNRKDESDDLVREEKTLQELQRAV